MTTQQRKRKAIIVDKPTAIAIEFTKTYKVMETRLNIGYSAYELSFLLGKNDFFVRDVENPLTTKRYNPDDTNYLLLILKIPLKMLMEPMTVPNTLHLKITTSLSEQRGTIYQIELKDATTNNYIHFLTFEVEVKNIEPTTKLNFVSFERVELFIDDLIKQDFFHTPKRALDIFEGCKSYFGNDFHPRNMIKVLNLYTNRKSGIEKLTKDKRDAFGRRLFSKC